MTGRSGLHDTDFMKTANDSILECRPLFTFEMTTQTLNLGKFGLTGIWFTIEM